MQDGLSIRQAIAAPACAITLATVMTLAWAASASAVPLITPIPTQWATFTESLSAGSESMEGLDNLVPETISLDVATTSGPISSWAIGRVQTFGGDVTQKLPPMADVQTEADNMNISGSGAVRYHMQVRPLAGAPGTVTEVPVAIKIEGSVSASVSATDSLSGGSVSSGAYVWMNGLEVLTKVCNASVGSSSDCNEPVSTQFTKSFQILSLTEFYMVAGTGISISNGTGMAQAVVDPVFEIDPSSAYAEFFVLAFSNGIEYSGPPGTTGGGYDIPEPGALALFMSGLAGLALVRRRRRAASG